MDERKIDFSLISSERAPRNVGKTAREKAKKGDTKAATFIRDTVGEKPTERHEVTGADGTPFVRRQLTQSEAREFLRKLDEEL